jgi:hypothetical protein
MVGRYTVSVRTDPAPVRKGGGAFEVSMRQNGSVTLIVTITGDGYLKPADPPVIPTIAAFELFEPKVTDKLDKTSGRMASTRTIEIPMIAKKEGRHTIPPIPISWFNPETDTYTTMETAPVTVNVLKGVDTGSITTPQAVTGNGAQIRYIKPDADALADYQTPPHRTVWFWGVVVAPLLLLPLVGMVARRRQRSGADRKTVRRDNALKSARVKLAEARSAVDNPAQFFAALDLAIRGYLADRWDESAPTVTRDLVATRLGEEGREILALFELVEQGRYAPGGIDARTDAVDRAELLLGRLEKQI